MPCDSGGYIKFAEYAALCGKLEELRANERTYHFNMHKNTSVRIHKNPMFSLKFQLVDYCYNMSLTEQNGSFYMHPAKESLECYFRIHLPYGNRIELNLVVNNRSVVDAGVNPNPHNYDKNTTFRTSKANLTSTKDYSKNDVILDESMTHINISLSDSGRNGSRNSSSNEFLSSRSGSRFSVSNENALLFCNGLRIQIHEFPTYKWSYCVDEWSGTKRFSLISQGNTLVLHVVKVFNLNEDIVNKEKSGSNSALGEELTFSSELGVGHDGPKDSKSGSGTSLPSLYLEYTAKPIPEIVSDCAFGWVAMQQFCVTTADVPLSWLQSEEYCVGKGGHLASIRSEAEQKTIDQLLLNR